jgi:hypothetical protein
MSESANGLGLAAVVDVEVGAAVVVVVVVVELLGADALPAPDEQPAINPEASTGARTTKGETRRLRRGRGDPDDCCTSWSDMSFI